MNVFFELFQCFNVIITKKLTLFRPCEEIIGPCSFPQAHVLLTRKQQLLMVGQPYRISVNIDMPESEQNLRLGMFMVCAEMRDQRTQLRNHACRSAMLHYRLDFKHFCHIFLGRSTLVGRF